MSVWLGNKEKKEAKRIGAHGEEDINYVHQDEDYICDPSQMQHVGGGD
jgi:hypothetical protein